MLCVKKGAERVLTELENSKCPYKPPENLRTQCGRKLLREKKGLGRELAELE